MLDVASSVLSSPASRLDTLPAWPWDPFDPAAPPTLGWLAAQWSEAWLIQPNGPRAGKPFQLTGGQLRFLLWWYALDRETQWLYSHGVRRLAKGSGKSPFAAVLALIEFCGPVRLERFDDREPGGVLGRPVDMPLVQIAATAESQTANTMRMVRAFAPKGSAIVDAYDLDPGKTRYYKLPEGTLEVITSSPTAAEGAETSFTVGDETEHWTPARGGPDLMATLADNAAKSGSRMVETANAWVPGIESVAEDSWDAWVAQEEGNTADDTAILYDARLAPPDTDMSDPESLEKALQWVYGDCDWKRPSEDAPPDVRPIMKRIWTLSSRPDDSKRKYLNRPTVAADAWTTPEEWELLNAGLLEGGRDLVQGEEVALFFDGSKTRDATALVGCCITDGHVFVVDVWEPKGTHDKASTAHVDVELVDLAVEKAFSTLNVVGFFADVQEWESFTKIDWPKRYRDRLRIMAVPTGKDPQAIAWDMRGHSFEFTRAAELVLAEIDEGSFTHDGHPVLARHVANMRNRPNRWGMGVGKESPSSPLKIDAGICMVGARMVRRLVLAVPVPEQRSGVVV